MRIPCDQFASQSSSPTGSSANRTPGSFNHLRNACHAASAVNAASPKMCLFVRTRKNAKAVTRQNAISSCPPVQSNTGGPSRDVDGPRRSARSTRSRQEDRASLASSSSSSRRRRFASDMAGIDPPPAGMTTGGGERRFDCSADAAVPVRKPFSIIWPTSSRMETPLKAARALRFRYRSSRISIVVRINTF